MTSPCLWSSKRAAPTVLATLCLCAALHPRALVAQDTTAVAASDSAGRDSIAREVERLRREVEELRAASERQNQRLMELDERAAAQPAVTGQASGDTSARRTLPSSRGIYGKPFVKRFGSGTSIGGYVDMEYRNDIDAHESAFDQHRLIPFIFSEITDRLHFGTEIEFEHAPKIEIENGEPEGAGEVTVEFATLDYTLREALNIRGGLILSPLGRFNLVHDSPVNDLTDRPLVDRTIIPTTLSEAGFGLFGTIYPTARSLLSYEAYVVNGFTTGVLGDEGLEVGEGASVGEDDNNFGKSVVARLALSPFLGLEVAASAHTGPYAARGDERVFGDVDSPIAVTFTGKERLTIAALDATWQRGPFELLGELAQSKVGLPAADYPSSFASRQRGYYVQGNAHFGHGLLAPRATSVFTGVARYDNVDRNLDVAGAADSRLTLGLNWRPVEDAVIKADYQWNWRTPEGLDRHLAGRGVRLSMATYF